MPDWDADSPRLRKNLENVIDSVQALAAKRQHLSVALARDWHRKMMTGLSVPDLGYIGTFRGPPDLTGVEVAIGGYMGTASSDIAAELDVFERELNSLIDTLDNSIAPNTFPDARQLTAVITTCAWAHAEWVRIHPFANGSGRTARLWGNLVAMRYGLPPFITLRPRPQGDYGDAAKAAMRGDYHPTVAVFMDMLKVFLNSE